MPEIQILPHTTKESFRFVVFTKDGNANVDADISLVARLKDGTEIVFLPAPKNDRTNFMYPESSSRFLHRIEKGIYLAQSRNRRLRSMKEIAVRARINGKVIRKTAQIRHQENAI